MTAQKLEAKKLDPIPMPDDVVMHKVESTNIKAVGHDMKSRLFLTFNTGKTYAYDKVSVEVGQQMIHAESVGKFFHQFILPKAYDFHEVIAGEDPPVAPQWRLEEPMTSRPLVQIVGKLQTSTELAAGYDLYAQGETELEPGQRCIISSGIKLAMPDNLCALVVPRSGLAAKHGISITNAPGLIDPDYRGEIGVIVHNLGREPFRVVQGDKIAQLLFVPFVRPVFIHVKKLPESERGEGGFGSTGK
jgi:dUTP pyrophosphatase